MNNLMRNMNKLYEQINKKILRFGYNFGIVIGGKRLCSSITVSGKVKNAIADKIIRSLQS